MIYYITKEIARNRTIFINTVMNDPQTKSFLARSAVVLGVLIDSFHETHYPYEKNKTFYTIHEKILGGLLLDVWNMDEYRHEQHFKEGVLHTITTGRIMVSLFKSDKPDYIWELNLNYDIK